MDLRACRRFAVWLLRVAQAAAIEAGPEGRATQSANQGIIYPHDELVARVLSDTKMGEPDSWQQKGGYTYPGLSKTMREFLEPYRMQVGEARGMPVAEEPAP